MDIHGFHGTQLIFALHSHGFERCFMTERSYSDTLESSQTQKTTLSLQDSRVRAFKCRKHFSQISGLTSGNLAKVTVDSSLCQGFYTMQPPLTYF